MIKQQKQPARYGISNNYALQACLSQIGFISHQRACTIRGLHISEIFVREHSHDDVADDYIVVDSIRAVALDEMHGFVYWYDRNGARVRRATLDGSNHTDIYNSTKDQDGRKLSCVMDRVVWCLLL